MHTIPSSHARLARRALFAGACAVLALALVPLIARAEPVPANLRAAILLRALRYEAGFSGSRDRAVLAVISRGGTSASDARTMGQQFAQLARGDAAGRPLDVQTLSPAADDAAAASVTQVGAKVVYVAQGAEAVLPRLGTLPRGTIVLCADGNAVGTGCMLAVETDGSQSRLVVDLPRSQRGGLSFDARMLRLARVVR